MIASSSFAKTAKNGHNLSFRKLKLSREEERGRENEGEDKEKERENEKEGDDEKKGIGLIKENKLALSAHRREKKEEEEGGEGEKSGMALSEISVVVGGRELEKRGGWELLVVGCLESSPSSSSSGGDDVVLYHLEKKEKSSWSFLVPFENPLNIKLIFGKSIGTVNPFPTTLQDVKDFVEIMTVKVDSTTNELTNSVPFTAWEMKKKKKAFQFSEKENAHILLKYERIKMIEERDLSARLRYFPVKGLKTFDIQLWKEREPLLPSLLLSLIRETEEGKNDLTEREMVIVKEIWNRQLAWRELTIDTFCRRLLVIEPNLEIGMGPFLVRSLEEEFFGYFDLAVRNLLPETERTGRESYRALHPDKERRCNSILQYAQFFCDIGMKEDHWILSKPIFLDSLLRSPYLRDYEKDILKEEKSFVTRFYNKYVIYPAFLELKKTKELLSKERLSTIRSAWKRSRNKLDDFGVQFYMELFEEHPETRELFDSTDMDQLSLHLFQAVDQVVRLLGNKPQSIPLISQLVTTHLSVYAPPAAFALLGERVCELLGRKGVLDMESQKSLRVSFRSVTILMSEPQRQMNETITRATEFMELMSKEFEWSPFRLRKRMKEILQDIKMTGTYTQTTEEVTHGMRVGWRNSAKCIGRIAWKNLIVRDKRHVLHPDAIFQEIIEHLNIATNGGSIEAVMTVFRPRQMNETWGIRSWNTQFVRYACYQETNPETGETYLLGDSANLTFTKVCIDFGWTPPSPRTAFDILPMIIESPGYKPKMYEFNREKDIAEVNITHPQNSQFSSLGLKWVAVPAITAFRINIGGVEYSFLPFNGWFMGSEIARDFAERYENTLPKIAKLFDLDTSTELTLWKDRAWVELNTAVLHSFKEAKMSMVDHMTANKQFLVHTERERKCGRETPAQWSWVVPPIGGSICELWHYEMRDFVLRPQYAYQADIWDVERDSEWRKSELIGEKRGERGGEKEGEKGGEKRKEREGEEEVFYVVFGSETGLAENFARKVAREFKKQKAQFMSLNEFIKPLKQFISKKKEKKTKQKMKLFIITSTFGDGNAPESASEMEQFLRGERGREREREEREGEENRWLGIEYCVLALGSSIYPNFCKFGVTIDGLFTSFGAQQMMTVMKADEVKFQTETMEEWFSMIKRIIFGAKDQKSDENVSLLSVEIVEREKREERERGEEEREGEEREKNLKFLSEAIESPQNSHLGSLCKCTQNKELLHQTKQITKEEEEGRSTRMVSFSLSNEEMRYETGDHVSVQPMNFVGEVESLAMIYGVGLGDLVQFVCCFVPREKVSCSFDQYHIEDPQKDIAKEKEKYQMGFPTPATFARIFGFDLDLTIRTNTAVPLLSLLRSFAREEREREELSSLKEVVSSSLTPQIPYSTVSELLLNFPSSRPPLGRLIEILPRMRPRMYSISSSSLLKPNLVDLTVGVLQQEKLKGVCSNYLKNINIGEYVRMKIHTSSFRLPKSDAPILMVGPGTGIAPFIGFLEEIHSRSQKTQEIPTLLHGCRTDREILHFERLKEWEESEKTKLVIAFSRMQPEIPKTYVQDWISKNSKIVWKMLQQPNFHYYICGDGRMADDVLKTLIKVITMDGDLSYAQTLRFLDKMKKEGRYQTDVWGLTLNFKDALEATLLEQNTTKWFKKVKSILKMKDERVGKRDRSISNPEAILRSISPNLKWGWS